MALLIFGVSLFLIVTQTNSITLQDPGKVCPPDNLIKPCSCGLSIYGNSYVKLTCGEIKNQDILTDVLEKSKGYQFVEFEFYDSSVMFIPEKIFEIGMLKILNVASVNFIDLFEKMPPANHGLETISIMGSFIMRGVNWNHFSNFRKLNVIRFWDLKVYAFNQTFMDSVSKSLTSLEAYLSSTRTLADGCFAGFKNLKRLTVEGGSLTELKRNMFPSNLDDFVFSAHKIASIPIDLFRGMNLVSLDLSGNLLTTMDERAFPAYYGRLRVFTIEQNPIRCDCGMEWVLKYNRRINYFAGQCAEPERLKGKLFKDLILSDFPNC